MEDRQPFVDAHVHFWDLGIISYPWLTPPFTDDGPNGNVGTIACNYGLFEYGADSARWDVRGVVHVEAGADSTQALKETDWLQQMAVDTGMPNAIVAFAALHDPKVGQLLEAHAQRRNVRGVRHIVNWHPDAKRSYLPVDVTQSDAWTRGFTLLQKYGLSFDLQAYPAQFSALADLFVRHPDIPVIVNHNGMMIGDRGRSEWRRGMQALASVPHVTVKISGMGFAFRPWSIEQIRQYVLETIDMFGPGRCMFASDFPTDKLFGTLDEHLSAYSQIVSDFAPKERHAMFAGNADRVYRLGLGLS